jgi:hypothetical protein
MTYVEQLDEEWAADGFLGKLREGVWSAGDAARFLTFLRSIEIPDGALVPKRALSQFWFLPSFLSWQRDRVAERAGNAEAFDRFVTEVHNVLEDVLGVP